jgi:tRNA (cytidine/uridine-2'-O-)-methyltransferase
MLHLVLFQPEIPHNTGAIGRLCLAAGARLHLIRPLGYSLEDKYLRRSGLDYWEHVDVHQWDSWEALRGSAAAGSTFYFIECEGGTTYWEAKLTGDEVYLVFGPETRSIPPSIIDAERCLRIPMREGGTRSLNLATAAAIVLYEAVRQRAAL